MRKILRETNPIEFIKDFCALASIIGAGVIWIFVGEALLP